MKIVILYGNLCLFLFSFSWQFINWILLYPTYIQLIVKMYLVLFVPVLSMISIYCCPFIFLLLDGWNSVRLNYFMLQLFNGQL